MSGDTSLIPDLKAPQIQSDPNLILSWELIMIIKISKKGASGAATLDNSLAILQNVKPSYHKTQKFYSWDWLLMGMGVSSQGNENDLKLIVVMVKIS